MSDNIQIFLAHANEDKAEVLNLYDRLKTEGYDPWLDKKDLLPGQNWREEIPKAIKKSDIFIACLSQKSVSKPSYVQKEFRLALNTYAEKPPGTIYLIPLKLDDCEIPDLQIAQLGVNLRDIHWLNYWEPDSFENLVKAIEYNTKPNSSPSVTPPITETATSQRQKVFQDFAKHLESQTLEKQLQIRKNFNLGYLRQFQITISGLKQSLKRLGFYQGEIDEEFNKELTDSISNFQSENDLVIDGIFGKDSLQVLRKLEKNSP